MLLTADKISVILNLHKLFGSFIMKKLVVCLSFLLLAGAMMGCSLASQAPPESDESAHTSICDPIPASSAISEEPSVTTTVTSAETTVPPVTEPTPPPVCKASLVGLALTADDNPALASDLSFAIDEASLTATLELDYQNYADLATLSSARLTAQTENGVASFPAQTADGAIDLLSNATCVITDADGVAKNYTLTVNRKVYQLPIVNITLREGIGVDDIDRNETTSMTFSLDCSGAADFDSLEPVTGKIRGRGNSTWKWEKKPYKIKLDEKASLLGLSANRDWILLANYADKSLIRNTLAYEMGRVLDKLTWTPTQYPVDLFVNGEYRGVYSLGEHMEVANGRVDIDESSEAVDTGYLIELGGVSNEDIEAGVDYFHTNGRLIKYAAFVSPDEEEITDAQKAFIKEYFQKAEDAIVAGEGYEEYIDVDSFVDWILIHELSYNLDACYRRSCYFTKDKGGKLKMGPIWDFDLAFGNLSVDNPDYDDLLTIGSEEEDAYVKPNWCTYLLKDPEFCARLYARWEEIRQPLLEEANRVIDMYSALLDGSQQENFEVWQIWGIRAGYQSRWCADADSYPEQIRYLKDFLEKRAEWLDGHLPGA